MKVTEKLTTRFEIEDGDTIHGIVETLRRSPTGYGHLPVKVTGNGSFEVVQPLQ